MNQQGQALRTTQINYENPYTPDFIDKPATIYASLPIVSSLTGAWVGKTYLCRASEAWESRNRKGFEWVNKAACVRDKQQKA